MSISRRAALVGATAAAVVTGAATAPLAARAALAGDPVIGLAQQLRAASTAWHFAIDAFEDASHRVGFNICALHRTVPVETSDGRASWGAEEIRAAAEDGRNYYRLTPEQRDAALAQIERRHRESLKLCQELGIEPLRKEREHCEARFWDLQARVLDMPATTLGGVLTKMRGFYHDGEIAKIRAGDDPVDGLPSEWAASVYRDLERLAEGARS